MHHLPTGYRRPWAVARPEPHELQEDKRDLHFDDENGFRAIVDVHHFLVNEIKVQTRDNNIIVECKHRERENKHGSIERHFVRKYVLPDGYDMRSVQSMLGNDGILTITAPPPSLAEQGFKILPIVDTSTSSHHIIRNQDMRADVKLMREMNEDKEN
jgi:crystallin, alpha B